MNRKSIPVIAEPIAELQRRLDQFRSTRQRRPATAPSGDGGGVRHRVRVLARSEDAHPVEGDPALAAMLLQPRTTEKIKDVLAQSAPPAPESEPGPASARGRADLRHLQMCDALSRNVPSGSATERRFCWPTASRTRQMGLSSNSCSEPYL
jgi:hypothetical protein